MTTSSRAMRNRARIAATGLFVGVLAVAGAASAAPQLRAPTTHTTTPTGEADAFDAQVPLQPRFSTAGVDPTKTAIEPSSFGGSIAAGPQYRLSEHAAWGGSVVQADIGGSDPIGRRTRYVFGLRGTL